MKKSTYNFNGRKRLLLAFLCVCLLTGISFLINYKTQAEADNPQAPQNKYSLKSFSVERESSAAVNVGERTSVWLKLEKGKPLDTTFYGNDAAISALRANAAEPTAQVSTDINADGYADLVSGFRNAAGGGLIALHRVSRQAFEPTDENILADLRRGVFPATFEKDALILEVPTAPDFIFTGRFSRNSDLDLVFASRGGTSLFVMSSDGKGSFGAAREITLDGEITALASDSFDASKIYTGLVVASRNGKSTTVSVFDGTNELERTSPRKFQVEGDVGSLILANPGGAAQGRDVFGLANGEIFTMRRIGNRNTSINKVELPFRAVDIAVGEFIRDREVLAEIAVLSEDGNVSYLTRGTLDTRPFTTDDAYEYFRENGGRGRGTLPTKTTTDNLSNDWSVAETHQLGVYSLSGNSSARTLQKAYITGHETEDLLVTDSKSNRVRIIFKEPNYDADKTSFTGETKFQNVDFAASPAAVLPMRLNVMGQQGFVVFNKGNLEPTALMVAPNAIFNVTTTTDENNGACSGAGTGCSVREAINAANGAAGDDMITFTPNGTHQLTIDVAGTENTGTEGDLDVTQGLAIVGNGTGNTILQAGTNATNGIDKVLSFNPNFNAAFASSITGVTVRFGRNPSTFFVDGFGGGFDWDSFQTGTLTVSNVIVDQNTTFDGDGGGVVATSTPAGGNSFVSITNSTISNNDPDRTGANSPLGGALFVGTVVTYRLTTTIMSGNTVAGGNNSGQGGGVYAFGPASSAGKSFMTGSTVSMNTAPSDGGGVHSLQPLDINTPTIISNNSSGRFGGGLFVNHGNGTTAMSEATMVGNSATTTGSAIYLGSATVSNVLNVSFSRIVGNTGAGLDVATAGGTATIENNWWGCNSGPGTTGCDTAGTAGGGSVDFDPWLQLRLTASPNTTPVVGESRSLTASFLLNSAGGAVAVSNLDVLIGLPVTWSASGGTISGQQTTIQASGTATATFTATAASPPDRTATAQVDNGPATVNFTVGKASTTLSGLMDSPDPSVTGQAYTVSFTLSVNSPGMGTPTGSVTVTDGTGGMCTANLPSTSCMLTSTSAGAKTLTFTYSGDANFNGTMLTTGHTVNKADTTSTITGESADPTAQGEVFTVFYTVTVNSPGAGTPTGNVTVSDGANSCVGTVAAGQCSLFLNNVGVRTLTATYASDANFNGSVSPGVPHTVLPILAASVSVSGRVLTAEGRGIPYASVVLTDENGQNRIAVSNAFGYYRFEGVQTGATYFFNVRHREFQFAPRTVTVNDDVQGLDFTPIE